MEKTRTELWKEQYELLLKAYTSQQIELAQWRAGGILWTWEDVHIYASDEMGYSLSQAEAEGILKKVIRQHDADQGVSWLTIRNAIQQFKINK
jgi:alanine dehydrogenase